jgi:hypothetical protein
MSGGVSCRASMSAGSISSDGRAGGEALIAMRRRRVGLLILAVVAGTAGAAGAWAGLKLFLRGLRTARIAASYAYKVATLSLYRRCPDCRKLIRTDARVCRHCGYRRPPAPPAGRRARRRAGREVPGQAAIPSQTSISIPSM